jgi:glycosyltransferase involved in cell wall biosynthesis
MKKIVVFDSHPVQYRVPIWKELSKSKNVNLHVVYATDCSVKGYNDTGFGTKVAWDGGMLEDYDNTILNSENGTPLKGWSSLTGKGVLKQIKDLKPDYILLTGLNYKYDMIVYILARAHKIPLWLRCENQDYVTVRSKLKSIVRSFIYKNIYKGFSRFLYIGELNKAHYVKHGVPEKKLTAVKYTTINRFADYTNKEKLEIRQKQKDDYQLDGHKYVIGFSGKLIPKKNPDLLLECVRFLPEDIKRKINFLFIGSGSLENSLKAKAVELNKEYGIKTIFTGFVNQSQMPNNYLAVDVIVLPSRKQGETWGLVANEGLQAGVSVIVSDSVGSHKDFGKLELFKVCKTENAEDLAYKIVELLDYKLDFDWAQEALIEYSIATNVKNISALID